MTTRSEFLDRIRAGLGRRTATPPTDAAPPVTDDLVRLVHQNADAAATFAASAAAAGLTVHRCALSDSTTTLHAILASLSPNCIVLDDVGGDLSEMARNAVEKLGVKVIAPRATRSLDSQFDADVGITGVVCAIAETGTLVVASDATRSRGTFMIPPVHVAIVLESQIIPDMMDLWARLGPMPTTAVTLVSGPSKTADIEGILVTGVHGPGAVHVLLIADGPR